MKGKAVIDEPLAGSSSGERRAGLADRRGDRWVMTHGCRPEIALSASLRLAEGPGYLSDAGLRACA